MQIGSRIRPKNNLVLSWAFSFVNLSQEIGENDLNYKKTILYRKQLQYKIIKNYEKVKTTKVTLYTEGDIGVGERGEGWWEKFT